MSQILSETSTTYDQQDQPRSTEDQSALPERLPLSFGQERLWFVDQLQPNNPLYNIPLALRVSGQLHLPALQRALETIVARHEILRTKILSENGNPFQIITDDCRVHLSTIDLTSTPLTKQEAELQRVLSTEARRPFDLANEPFVRITLIQLAPEEHVLMVNMHHIASDEWSLRVLLRELFTIYDAESNNQTASLPDLPIQYADYALWQRDWMQGENLDELINYWRRQLDGKVSSLNLPTDRLRPTVQRQDGSHELLRLPRSLSQELRRLCQKENSTLFVVTLAAFQTLLYRYTGQEEILVGSPVAGRTRPELEDLIGFFVNTIVLRSHFSRDLRFKDLLASVRETTLDALQNQELPFEKLVETLQPERQAGMTPLVQVMFSLESAVQSAYKSRGLSITPVEVNTATAKFDIVFVVRDEGEELSVLVEYNTDLFEPATIQRLIGHYQVLLQAIVAQPDLPVSKLPLLTQAERQLLLTDWNNTQSPYPKDSTLSELFEAQVQLSPQAPALLLGQEQLTYSQLNVKANRLAHRLRQLGVGPEVMVGICAERSFDLIIGLLAIIKAGGAYVPLDPSYPKERLAFMMEDAKVPVLLIQRSLASALPPHAAQVLYLEDPLEGSSSDNPPGLAKPDSLAYVIYTSGSTGQPKGVLIPHKAILRLVKNTNYISIDASDRVAQVSNTSFDAATFEIWGPLLNGAQLVIINRETALSPKDFARELQESQITTLFLTTALFNQLASEAPHAFSNLKHLLFGGEAVDPKWVRRVVLQHNPKRLLHVYGPTEITTFASWHLVSSVPPDAPTISIGKPISNTTIYLLDPALEPVPVGVPGEVFIGGDGLARGYLNRPQLTAEKFITTSLQPGSSVRLYKTGDLARLLPDGSIEFIGRLDHQVKIRGFRVEPGEIEAVLSKHPQIRECIVTPLPDPSGGYRLVAYLVPHGEKNGLSSAAIRQFLKDRLPDYMIPTVFMFLPSLPLTPNGKVDRKRLPLPDRSRIEGNDNYVGPRNPIERELVSIWERCLKVTPVGITDNFFELGGHSLLAVRLFTEIEKALGKKLPLATLFQSPTIEQIARKLDDKQTILSQSLVVGIQPNGSRPPFFWIHSLGGDGGGGFFYYRKLAHLLGADQPSFGIRSPEEPYTCIEEMAARYVQEIRSFQSTGPYYLGGFCFGGTVAYEIARQLTLEGQQIGLLALLESAVPQTSTTSLTLSELKPFASNLRVWTEDLLHQTPEEWIHRISRKGKAIRKSLSKFLVKKALPSAEPDINDVIEMSQYPKDYVKYANAHWQALIRFKPQIYPGRVTLFRARKQPLSRFDITLGWRDVAAGGVAVNIIPGTHEKMLEEPNVNILAAELKACLAEAQIGFIEK